MRCPHCGAETFVRHRSPADFEGVTVRRHRCTTCGRIFTSAQVVLTPDLAEKLLDLAEESPTPTNSSAPTP